MSAFFKMDKLEVAASLLVLTETSLPGPGHDSGLDPPPLPPLENSDSSSRERASLPSPPPLLPEYEADDSQRPSGNHESIPSSVNTGKPTSDEMVSPNSVESQFQSLI